MTDNNMNNLLSQLSAKLGVDQNGIEGKAKQGDLDSLLKNADEKQAQAVKDVLSDPEKTRQVLSSPQAQALLKLFGGDKNA